MEKNVVFSQERGLLVYDLGPLSPNREGCVLELSLTLEGVCPETRTALAVTLTELDNEDREYPRGLHTLLIPAHHGDSPRNVVVRDLRFILPAELDVSGGKGRRFRAQCESHYVDFPACCRLEG